MFFKDRNEYEKYLKKNKVYKDNEALKKYFDWSENGELLLERNKLQESAIDVERYTSCVCWAMLKDNETMVLIKSQFGDVYRDLTIGDYYTAMYNNILLPQIANQFQTKSAKYYIAKNKGNKRKRAERKYLVTVDFKEQDEEIIHGEEMLEDMEKPLNETNIDELVGTIQQYLRKNGYNSQDIERIRIDFIKQSLFNRFVKQYDENNHNWGVLVDDKKKFARIAPVYDMDCSCEINKKSKIMRTTNDGSTVDLEQFVNQYKNEAWFGTYLEEVINKFDLEKAFEKSKEDTNTEIPDEYKERYKNFFALRFKELEDAYKKIIINKDKYELTDKNTITIADSIVEEYEK